MKKVSKTLVWVLILALTLFACQVTTLDQEGNLEQTISTEESGNTTSDDVTVTPDPLVAGRYAQIEYTGDLFSSTQVSIHYGFNGWNDVQDAEMVLDTYNNCWRISVSLPEGTTGLDFVFFNENNQWDNNSDQDWHYSVLTEVSSVEVNPATGIIPQLEVLNMPVQLLQNGSVVHEILITIKGTYMSAYFDLVSYGDYTVKMDEIKDGYRYSGETTVTVDSIHTEHVNLTISKDEVQLGALDLTPRGTAPANEVLGMNVDLLQNDTVVLSSDFILDGSSYVAARFDELAFGEYTAQVETVKNGYLYSGTASVTIDSTNREYNQIIISKTAVSQKTIHYFTTWNSANLHYVQENGNWTTALGSAMSIEEDNWFVITVENSDSIEFCFNNGSDWDSNNGANYSTIENEVWVKNGTIYTEKPDNQTSFYATANYIPYGYELEIRGNKTPLSWSTGIKLNGSGTNGSITLDIEGSFEYKYTLINSSGDVKWELLEGNRSGQSGQGHYDFPTF